LKQVDEEIQARIEKLVSLGDLAEDEGRRLAHKLLALGAAVRTDRAAQDEALERALQARGVPTRDDIARLSAVIDQLTAEVESLRAQK
jgi:polyhydroxyalkanoate synthesis regulator phasin